MDMTPTIEPIGQPVTVGEAPTWDEETQCLYFVDCIVGSINRYDPMTKAHYSAQPSSERVSLIIRVEGEKNRFVISEKNNLKLITWDGINNKITSNEFFVNLEKDSDLLLNDGKVDPAGRIWAGSRGQMVKFGEWEPERGSLYRVNKDKSVSKQLTNITLANGLAWSPDNTKFYYIDSTKYRVDGYDFDIVTGNICNGKIVFDFKENKIKGLPDGMTIDAEGKLWVAVFGGAQILRIDPTNGKLLSSVKFPSLQITSACFGGPNYEDLYVTSGNYYMNEEQLAEYPHAGSCFRVTNLGVKGLPSLTVKL